MSRFLDMQPDLSHMASTVAVVWLEPSTETLVRVFPVFVALRYLELDKGVMKSVTAELTDETNIAQAVSLMPVVYAYVSLSCSIIFTSVRTASHLCIFVCSTTAQDRLLRKSTSNSFTTHW